MVYQYTRPRGPIAAMYGSPGPACYSLPGLVGYQGHDPRSTRPKRAAWCFGNRHKDMDSAGRSPGPVYFPDARTTRHGKEGEPHYSLYGRPRDLKMYSFPPPGTYSPERANPHTSPSAPSYSFGVRHKHLTAGNNPGPDRYSLPPLIGKTVEGKKKAAPSFSLYGRSKVGGFHEDLSKTPGPCAYSTTSPSLYKRRLPAFSMTSRSMMPGDPTIKPGPGAHSPERVWLDKRESPRFSFGMRHSQYVVPCFSADDMLD